MLGLCIVCAYLIKVYRFYYLPESGAAMLVGLIVGACARVFYPSRKEMEILRFNVRSLDIFVPLMMVHA